MIAKILRTVAGFPGVNYNTNKVDRNKGELLVVSNFGPLQALGHLRPQDYINYLQLLSKLNPRVKKPQFHAVISVKGKSYDKTTLSRIAGLWLKEMGYAAQPYLVVFHKDTENNHVHLVTTRVNHEGEKISSAYEKVRAVKSLNKVLGYDFGMQYRFSTKAQFYMVLESRGFLGRDFDEKKLQQKTDRYLPDKIRINELKQLFLELKNHPHFIAMLREQYQVDIVFHTADNKAPYGYSIIDHQTKQVLKGSEVLPLKQLISGANLEKNEGTYHENPGEQVYVHPVGIADDVDDEAIHGRNRRRKKKARTNSR